MDSSAILDICNSYIKDGNVIKGIISTSEYYIQTAAQIANYFKLPSANEDAIINCRNKYKQYEILYESGLLVPKTMVVNTIEDFKSKISDMNFPVIVKPIEGSGSVGVRLCSNYKECYDFIKQLLSTNKNERGIAIDNRVLLEDYILGEEYSGEVFNGKLIGITKKHLGELPYFVETGHEFPAILNHDLYKEIENSILKAVKALNLEWGACHIEFRLLNAKVFFIEINPRLAGGFIPEIIKESTGIDLIDNQLRATLNLPVKLNRSRNYHMGIRFIIPTNEGIINCFGNSLEHTGILEVKQYKSAGTKFIKHSDFRDRIGHVIFNMDIITPYEVESMISNLEILGEQK